LTRQCVSDPPAARLPPDISGLSGAMLAERGRPAGPALGDPRWATRAGRPALGDPRWATRAGRPALGDPRWATNDCRPEPAAVARRYSALGVTCGQQSVSVTRNIGSSRRPSRVVQRRWIVVTCGRRSTVVPASASSASGLGSAFRCGRDGGGSVDLSATHFLGEIVAVPRRGLPALRLT